MDTAKTLAKLNECLRHEWTGVAQYAQAGFVVSGLLREVYADLFFDNAKESFGHAKSLGNKIVAMGGVPTVERNAIKQSDDLDELIAIGLEFERQAVKHYTEALALAEGDRALVVYLEDILKDEQEGVDRYLQILRQHKPASGSSAATKAS